MHQQILQAKLKTALTLSHIESKSQGHHSETGSKDVIGSLKQRMKKRQKANSVREKRQL